MFHLIAILDIKEHIKHLDVHKGKIPSVDIKCFGDHDDPLHTITLMFSGDMERQSFMNELKQSYK